MLLTPRNAPQLNPFQTEPSRFSLLPSLLSTMRNVSFEFLYSGRLTKSMTGITPDEARASAHERRPPSGAVEG